MIGHLQVSRMTVPVSASCAESTEVCVCCDVSEKAIATVAYMKTTDTDGTFKVQHLRGMLFFFGRAVLYISVHIGHNF